MQNSPNQPGLLVELDSNDKRPCLCVPKPVCLVKTVMISVL